MEDLVKVDLACGQNKKEGYVGVDIFDGSNVDIVHDLNIYPWPFEDESIDEINCGHYIEHIPHSTLFADIRQILEKTTNFEEFKESFLNIKEKDGFIKFINEIYRILKPGGKVHIVAPYYTSIRAYGDPTHVRYIADSSLWYLDKKWRDENNLSHYGIDCDFSVKISYFITNEMTLKSEEVRNRAFLHDWNAIDDIIIELHKRSIDSQ